MEVTAKATFKSWFWSVVGAVALPVKPVVMVLFKQPFLSLLLNLTHFGNCPSRLLTEQSNIYIAIQCVGILFKAVFLMKVVCSMQSC